MNIRIFIANDIDEHAARRLADGLSTPALAPDRSAITIVRVRGAGLAQPDLPREALRAMALLGADAFPLTLVDGQAARNGRLPTAAELEDWVFTPDAGATGPARPGLRLDLGLLDAAAPCGPGDCCGSAA